MKTIRNSAEVTEDFSATDEVSSVVQHKGIGDDNG